MRFEYNATPAVKSIRLLEQYISVDGNRYAGSIDLKPYTSVILIESSTQTASTTFYRDGDGDGFGKNSETIIAPALPNGYAARGGDCNDADATIYPGAPEICDGKDNNCNGEIDERLLALPYFEDRDGDGFGNPFIVVRRCIKPEGYVGNNTDCDDTKSSVHPEAQEICGNGIDDNCDGQIDENCSASELASVIVNDTTAHINERVMTVQVKLSRLLDKDVSIDFSTVKGTARPFREYIPYNGNLIIPAGALSGVIKVNLVASTTLSSSRYFTIQLSKSTNAVLENISSKATIIYSKSATSKSTASTDKTLEENVSDPNLGITIDVFPNPSAQAFSIVIKSGKLLPVNITVFDALGRVVEEYKSVSSNYRFLLGQKLMAGTYYLAAVQGSERSEIKMIKL
jgi:hypothetical protein